MDPLVSVIIPVYNGEEFLSETFASVERQTYPSWEIVAVNDGSLDKSAAILEAWSQRLGERCRVITVPNGGVSRARNRGVQEARGAYLAFLDQDDLWAAEKLSRQMDILQHDLAARVVYTNLALIDGKGSVLQKKALRLGPGHRGDIFEELLFYNFIPISSVVVERSVFEKTGGFDPAYRLSEDLDLLLRLSRLTRIEYVDEPLVLYRVHAGNLSRNVDSINRETGIIVEDWRQREPGIFRRHPLKYVMFRANLLWMKAKSRIV